MKMTLIFFSLSVLLPSMIASISKSVQRVKYLSQKDAELKNYAEEVSTDISRMDKMNFALDKIKKLCLIAPPPAKPPLIASANVITKMQMVLKLKMSSVFMYKKIKVFRSAQFKAPKRSLMIDTCGIRGLMKWDLTEPIMSVTNEFYGAAVSKDSQTDNPYWIYQAEGVKPL